MIRRVGNRLFVEVEQPLIYLDQWAIRMFADEMVRGSRLLSGLGVRGTLLVSPTNFLELAGTACRRPVDLAYRRHSSVPGRTYRPLLCLDTFQGRATRAERRSYQPPRMQAQRRTSTTPLRRDSRVPPEGPAGQATSRRT